MTFFRPLGVAFAVSGLATPLIGSAPRTSPPTSPVTTPASTPGSTPATDRSADQVMPLTGLPVTDPTKLGRPALVVKIDNHPQARPQTGLNHADLVFEENVESLTRFAAVFQSDDAGKVGPIRSARTQDVLMLGSLGRPLFAWSGGNGGVTKAVLSSQMVDLGAPRHSAAYYRDRTRRVAIEHTLYSGTPALYALQPPFLPPPGPQFEYRAADDVVAGRPAAGADLAMDNVRVGWRWVPMLGTYLRTQNDAPHDTTDGGQVNAANVLILQVEYRPSPATPTSPEAQTIGSGAFTLLSGGKVVTGTWDRQDLTANYTLVADDGQLVLFTPGRTWIELARQGAATVVPSDG